MSANEVNDGRPPRQTAASPELNLVPAASANPQAPADLPPADIDVIALLTEPMPEDEANRAVKEA
jgi:hypothetical protein